MAGRRWTPEELDRLHDLWGTTSPRTIARELGRTVPAILVRGSLDAARSLARFTAQDIRAARALLADGERSDG